MPRNRSKSRRRVCRSRSRRKTSRRKSRSRRKSHKRRSRRKSRRWIRTRFSFRTIQFNSRVKKYFDIKHITKVAQSILDHQDVRKRILRHNRSKFGILGRLRNLVNTLALTVTNHVNRETLMGVVDLGYRFGLARLSPITILFNTIMFGFIVMNDWQYYLLTPLGLSMLAGVVNNPDDQHDFINMLTHASVMGVAPSDILAGIPNAGIEIADKETYLGIAANFGSRRIIYETLTRLPGQLRHRR